MLMLQQYKLNDLQLHILHRRLTTDNVERAKIDAYFVIVLESFMLIHSFINYGFSLNLYIMLYISLLALAVVSLVIFTCTKKIYNHPTRTAIQHRYLMFYYIFMLTWGAVVTLADQAASYGHVTAYLTNFLVTTVLFIVPRRTYILLHILPTTLLVGGLLIYQKDYAIVTGHFINVAIFFIFATLGARFLYGAQVKNLAQELLLKETNQEMETLNKHLASLVHHDELTRIPNRRGLYNFVTQFTAEQPKTAAVYVLDLDAFKRYNDFYGHLAGDQALKSVAQAIHRIAFLPHHFAARFGGEEFVVVAFNATEVEAATLAENIFNAIEQLHIPHEASPYHNELSISLGYTIGDIHDQDSLEQLIKAADDSLYQAKENGRNQIQSTL